MKYLAILKDSLREAIDSKIFYVMVALSCVLAILVGSISFRPVPAEEALPAIVRTPYFWLAYLDHGRSQTPVMPLPAVEYHISDIEPLTQASEPQAADYRFVLHVQESNPDDFRKAVYRWSMPATAEPPDNNAMPLAPDGLVEEYLKHQFDVAGNLKVIRVKELSPGPAPAANQPAQAHFVERRQGQGQPGPAAADQPAQGKELRFAIRTQGTQAVRGWLHDPYLFFGAVPLRFLRTTLGKAVYTIEDKLVNGFGAWVAILVGIVITAFFIPNMLRKGTVDLLLVKPIHRWTLLIYKYIGGLSFMFLNTAVAVVGVWLALGLRSGIWAPGFLLTILVLTFFFAVLYAVSALCGVLTRSAVVAILVTCVVWFGLWLVGTVYTALDQFRQEERFTENMPTWVYPTADTIHFVLPRTRDLDVLTTQMLSREVLTEGEIRQQRIDRITSITWGESLAVSAVFIAIMLGLASWRFATKDY